MSSANSAGGIGLTWVLTIVFVVLKLTHLIDWSWWWVLSPLWISAGVSLVVLAIVGVSVLISDALDKRRWRKRAEARRNLPNRHPLKRWNG